MKKISALLLYILCTACNNYHEQSPIVKPAVDTAIPPSRFFDSSWGYAEGRYAFDFQLKRYGDSVKGTYCYTSPNKIDCSPDDTTTCYIRGTAKGNMALVIFNSNFTDPLFTDTALLVIDEKNKTLRWIRKTFHIHAYVPHDTILK